MNMLADWEKAYALMRALGVKPDKATKIANILLNECRPEPDDLALLLKAKSTIHAPKEQIEKCNCPVCSAGKEKPKPHKDPVIKIPELDDEEPKPNKRIEFN